MASKRNVKRRTCERKIAYASFAGAMKAKTHMKRKYGEAFDVYHCGYCKEFHIGHRTQGTRAKLRALVA